MNIIRKILYPQYQSESIHKDKIDYAFKMTKFIILRVELLKRDETVFIEKNHCKYAVIRITVNKIPVDVTISCYDLDRMRSLDVLGYILEWVLYRSN